VASIYGALADLSKGRDSGAIGEILLLDAMGVLYRAGDDVAELLVPFVRQHGQATLTPGEVDRAYVTASLGEMDAPTLWRRLGVDPALEDDYLAGHRLIERTLDALPRLRTRYARVGCLSNDVAAWSVKLRQHFDLERWIDPWFISGDLGLRKPSPEIYRLVLARLGVQPDHVIFVDDRPKNLDAARELGIRTVLFDARDALSDSHHRRIRSLSELL